MSRTINSTQYATYIHIMCKEEKKKKKILSYSLFRSYMNYHKHKVTSTVALWCPFSN